MKPVLGLSVSDARSNRPDADISACQATSVFFFDQIDADARAEMGSTCAVFRTETSALQSADGCNA
ncbi:MAG: hypothetical protein WD251_10245, partial [Saccharospirillum sp.]|uniref:hypothetical protein n=1 Tax=Saccharospirillum sp. TaxID=2033801 RepID=UPI0034A06C2A